MSLAATPALSLRPDRFDGIVIAEGDGFAMASLAIRRGERDAFAKASQELFATALPGPGKGLSGSPWSVFWTAPDQWFATAPIATHEDIERRLRASFGGSASITEQTGAWARLHVTGARVPAMMERLTMLDFAAMVPGAMTRSTVHHLNVFIGPLNDGFVFIGPRSSAGSLHHALVTAARSVT